MLEVISLSISEEEQQDMFSTMLDALNSKKAKKEEKAQPNISIIPISALTVEKINRNLLKASEFHEENNRKSWSEASRYYAAK